MSAKASVLDTGTDELLCHLQDGVAVVTLNRPQARNSLSDNLTPALRAMIKRAADDPDIGSLLITGAGTAFCAGGDVKGMASNQRGAETPIDERVALLMTRQRTLTGALVGLRKPTIAALPGPAAGAGLSIALACDLRIAARSAIVTTAYARVGLSGDYGIAWLLTRTVGSARARELLLLADKIDAERCETLGIVNRVVADESLFDYAFEMAKSLAQGPRVSYGLMKDNLDDAISLDFLTALDREGERMVQSSLTSDHRLAVRALIEKRRPHYSGA